jgi:hypothetical protein
LGIDLFDWQDTDASLSIESHLRWPSANPEHLATEIEIFAFRCSNSWLHVTRAPQDDLAALLSFLNTFDFRFIDLKHVYRQEFTGLLNWLLQQVCALCVP